MNDISDKTIYEAIKTSALKNPDSPAYDFLGFSRSYKEFLNDIERCAARLIELGAGENDYITIYLPNIPRALVLFYAINKIGAVSNFIHPKMPIKNHNDILKEMKPSLVFLLDSMVSNIPELLNIIPDSKIMLVRASEFMRPLPKLLFTIKTLFNRTADRNKNIGFYYEDKSYSDHPPSVKNHNTTATVLLTGGTTGDSKGVCLSSKNINAAALQTARNKIKGSGSEKMLAVLPVFHGYGLVNCIHTAFFEAAEVILLPYYKESMFKNAILRKKPNYILGIPRLYSRMADILENENIKLDFFRGLYCGGSKLSSSIQQKINNVLIKKGSDVIVREGYGLTECVGACTLMPAQKYKSGSVGVPYEGVKIKIRALDDSSYLAAGETGEICVCSDTVMNGYLGSDDCIKTDGFGRWLYTGDIGYVDEEGFVFFTDRKKRMIKISGYEVFPLVIESLISDIADVEKSCVIEVSKDGLSALKAYVVTQSANTGSLLDEIEKKLNKNLPRWSIPGEIEFIDSLPETLLKKTDYRAIT